jgi:hypothetical protein
MHIKIFTKKTIYLPTLTGWFLIILFFVVLSFVFLKNIHSFLSPVKYIKSDVAVVHGWLPDYALKKVVEDFEKNNYKLILVTGGPLDYGNYLVNYNSYARVAFKTLIKLGLDSSKIIEIPSPYVIKDRTYTEAISLKKWMTINLPNVKTVNLYSLGCHSRRSKLLFSKALGKDVKIGIIACVSNEYDPKKWWKYSEGIKKVFGETFAYIYSIFFY